MTEKQTNWRSYEEVAQFLLNEFASQFGLGEVQGKQVIPGKSGTKWEIDAKGVASNGEGFLIVECRCYTTSKVNQERVAGLAYRINDTGARGGLIVSPLELQSGAQKVATYSSIQHVTLDPQSTTTDYIMRFLNQVFVGFSASTSPFEGNLEPKLIKGGKDDETREAG